ncbi:putative transcription factor WD40-like family [Dioscorea sansibarensis]
MEANPENQHLGSPPSPAAAGNLGPRRLLDRSQFIRIILQALHSLGYSKAAAALESESGVALDSPEFTSLLFHSLSGHWLDCINTIDSIPDFTPESKSSAAFLVWKQHFMELLASEDGLVPAKDVLGSCISPLEVERGAVHRLSRAMISPEGVVPGEERLRRRIGMLLDLLGLMPDWVRMPSGRLEHLVETAVMKQLDSCIYHNTPEEVTLFEDHACSLERIPSKCVQTLYAHKNEVWFVQFSNAGKYLASSSKDCTAIVWEVKEDDALSLEHTLEGHGKPVSFLAWSPDDTMLLTCGNAEVLKLWDVRTGICKLTMNNQVNRVISSCAWFPDSKKIVCGSYEPDNRVHTCDIEGNELDVWEGERMPKVSDLAVTPDGNSLISICSNREIWIRDFRKGTEKVIPEEHSITSLSLSRDGKFMIVNLNSEEIHLWSVYGTSNTPNRYRGHKQGKYVIRSCFGGSDCLFLASGSEDSKIYVWQRHNEEPIQVLSGHLMTVNCVSWNPSKPHMLASASDDCTIRIWMATRNTGKGHA